MLLYQDRVMYVFKIYKIEKHFYICLFLLESLPSKKLRDNLSFPPSPNVLALINLFSPFPP